MKTDLPACSCDSLPSGPSARPAARLSRVDSSFRQEWRDVTSRSDAVPSNPGKAVAKPERRAPERLRAEESESNDSATPVAWTQHSEVSAPQRTRPQDPDGDPLLPAECNGNTGEPPQSIQPATLLADLGAEIADRKCEVAVPPPIPPPKSPLIHLGVVDVGQPAALPESTSCRNEAPRAPSGLALRTPDKPDPTDESRPTVSMHRAKLGELAFQVEMTADEFTPPAVPNAPDGEETGSESAARSLTRAAGVRSQSSSNRDSSDSNSDNGPQSAYLTPLRTAAPELNTGRQATATDGLAIAEIGDLPPEPQTRQVREFNMRLEGPAELEAVLRVTDRQGQVRIAVHTVNADLNTTLRADLSGLVSRLATAGYKAEVSGAAGAAAERSAQTEGDQYRDDRQNPRHGRNRQQEEDE